MIIEKARALGLALSESEEFRNMIQARGVMDEDAAISDSLAEYNRKQQTILEMLESSNADTETIQALSADMDRIQSQLMENAVFTRAMETQSAFQQLMNMVNHEIGVCIGVADEDGDGACTGSCSTCGGCKH